MPQENQAILHSYEIQLMLGILAEEQGVDIVAILDGTSISPAQLLEPAFRLTTEQEMLLYTRVAHANIDPTLAVRVGSKLGLANYGILGFGMMSASVLHEAVQLVADFSPLISWASSNQLRRVIDGNLTYWKLDIDPSARDSKTIELEIGSTFSSLNRVFQEISGVSTHFARIDLMTGYDALLQEIFEDHFRCEVNFGQPSYSVWFTEETLSIQLPHSQPHYASLMRDLCREEISVINEEGLIDQVRRTLASCKSDQLNLSWVASQFSVSERHLRRRLKAQGFSFQQLLDEFRLEKAQQYLTTTTVSTESIAHQLGFSDARAFRAAYKRLTGETPSETRAKTPAN